MAIKLSGTLRPRWLIMPKVYRILQLLLGTNQFGENHFTKELNSYRENSAENYQNAIDGLNGNFRKIPNSAVFL